MCSSDGKSLKKHQKSMKPHILFKRMLMQTKGLLLGLSKSNQPKIQWQHTFNLEHCQLEQPGKHRSALLQFLQRNILSPSIIFKKSDSKIFIIIFYSRSRYQNLSIKKEAINPWMLIIWLIGQKHRNKNREWKINQFLTFPLQKDLLQLWENFCFQINNQLTFQSFTQWNFLVYFL